MPKHTISRSNSPYLSIITGKSLVGSSDLTIILSRSAGSISSKRGRNLNHVLTVIGRMTILSPTSFPAGIDFLSLKSNGILTGCSVMEADSNLNKFFTLINLSKGAIPLYFRENSIIFATIIELFRPYPSKVCFYRRTRTADLIIQCALPTELYRTIVIYLDAALAALALGAASVTSRIKAVLVSPFSVIAACTYTRTNNNSACSAPGACEILAAILPLTTV